MVRDKVEDPDPDEPSDYDSDEGESDRTYLPNAPAEEISADELAQIKSIARIHDINYKSVNFGKFQVLYYKPDFHAFHFIQSRRTESHSWEIR